MSYRLNHSPRLQAIACLWMACSTPACLFVTRESGERMHADLLALRAEVAQLAQSVEQSAAQRAEAEQASRKRIDALQANVADWSKNARLVDADMGTQLERMLEETQRLRGAIEDNEHRLSETETRLHQELSTRLDTLKAASAREEKEAASQAVKNAAPRNKKQLLQYGLKLMQQGRKEDGRGVLRDIVRRFGKERGLADEALFALGSASFAEQQYEAALRDWVRLIDKFPSNAHAAEAYFKIGACSELLGRTDDARTFFTEVKNAYGNSPWAKSAKQRLDALASKSKGQTGKQQAPSGTAAPAVPVAPPTIVAPAAGSPTGKP